ncbi:MAG TPA: hypothetical protein VH374_21665 [Polyangia bacterium]|jgi:hypothetical protein|nr:hypothetical protein [Polyangia bacterium]
MSRKSFVTIALGVAIASSAFAGEAPTYELLVQRDKKYELVFSSTGQLTKEEAKHGKDED